MFILLVIVVLVGATNKSTVAVRPVISSSSNSLTSVSINVSIANSETCMYMFVSCFIEFRMYCVQYYFRISENLRWIGSSTCHTYSCLYLLPSVLPIKKMFFILFQVFSFFLPSSSAFEWLRIILLLLIKKLINACSIKNCDAYALHIYRRVTPFLSIALNQKTRSIFRSLGSV